MYGSIIACPFFGTVSGSPKQDAQTQKGPLETIRLELEE